MSCVRGNFHAQFLEGWTGAIPSGYSVTWCAESARGIAPRAAHRTGLEPLDSSGSCHPMKTAVLHLDRIGSSCCQLTKPAKTQVACPLRSPGITPVPHYYETVRPCSTHQYFRPRGASACAFSQRRGAALVSMSSVDPFRCFLSGSLAFVSLFHT